MLDTLLKHLDMVRLSVGLAGLVLAAGLMGCTGLIGGGGGDGTTPEEQAAIDAWVTMGYPAFQGATCTSCHGAGTGGAPTFLAGDKQLDVRTTILGFMPEVINLDQPQISQVLVEGVHQGPALNTDQASAILTWIQAEADAQGGSMGTSTDITTMPFQFQLCTSGTSGSPTCPINHVDISALPNAPALPGAHIDFVVQPLANDIYVTDLYATTGTDGLYIEHPLFVYLPPQGVTTCATGMAPPCPDDIDRFYDVKLDMMPTDPPAQIGGGVAAFTGFAPVSGAQLEITFKVVDKYRPDSSMGGTTTGCKVMTGTNGFYTTVYNVMAQKVGAGLTPGAMYCEQCHSSQGAQKNANAMAAMDISGIEGCTTDTSATSTCLTACDQVLSRITFSNIPNSGVILAPESGQDAAHPEKFGTGDFTTFQTALVNWATAENTAQ